MLSSVQNAEAAKKMKKRKYCQIRVARAAQLVPCHLSLDWLDLEMETNQREHQALQVLDQVIETPQAVRVPGLVHVHQAPDLAGGEADVLVSDHDLQLLSSDTVRLGPQCVILGHDLRA